MKGDIISGGDHLEYRIILRQGEIEKLGEKRKIRGGGLILKLGENFGTMEVFIGRKIIEAELILDNEQYEKLKLSKMKSLNYNSGSRHVIIYEAPKRTYKREKDFI